MSHNLIKFIIFLKNELLHVVTIMQKLPNYFYRSYAVLRTRFEWVNWASHFNRFITKLIQTSLFARQTLWSSWSQIVIWASTRRTMCFFSMSGLDLQRFYKTNDSIWGSFVHRSSSITSTCQLFQISNEYEFHQQNQDMHN